LIEEEISQSGRNIRLDQEDIQLIQLAALIYSLDSFFRVGSAAARAASITFEEFGLDGFQIGSTTFTRDNENTRRGEELATQMRRSISGTPLSRAIVTSPSMRRLITTLIRELSDG
jgi:hypothetical protein